MLRIYIGPNGYGKTHRIMEEIKDLEKKDYILLSSELVFADEMKDTVNSSFVMDYIIQELLSNDEVENAKNTFETLVDKSIEENQQMYNDIMDEVLALNRQQRKKDVIAPTPTKEYKKTVKINADDLKNSMGSGQKLQFLLKLIQHSNKKYVYLDEPENHTHPSMLHITARLINELSETKEVCVATHSPELLNLLNIDFKNIYIFNDPEFRGPQKIDFEKAVVIPETINLENINHKSRSYYDMEILKNNILELHKKEFFEALFSKDVYIVEGVNDELFLKKMLYKYGKQYEQYSIFHCYGKPHYLPFINIFENLGIKVIVLFDKDNESDIHMAINNAIKDGRVYHEFNMIIESELGYKGNKSDSTSWIEFLDNYDEYEKYKYLVEIDFNN